MWVSIEHLSNFLYVIFFKGWFRGWVALLPDGRELALRDHKTESNTDNGRHSPYPISHTTPFRWRGLQLNALGAHKGVPKPLPLSPFQQQIMLNPFVFLVIIFLGSFTQIRSTKHHLSEPQQGVWGERSVALQSGSKKVFATYEGPVLP